MRDISEKRTTLRTATAQALIEVTQAVMEKIRTHELPKGDLFETTRAVVPLAAKRTDALLPFCHPIHIEWVGVDIQFKENEIILTVSCTSIDRTGCEMEALTGAAIGALHIYDMLKPLGESVIIRDIRLLEKKGGKSSFTDPLPKNYHAGVLVISDSVSRGKRIDKSGKYIVSFLKDLGVPHIELESVEDEIQPIRDQVISWCDKGFHLIITTGGTGAGPRDVTPEALEPLFEKKLDAIAQASVAYGLERTPYAMLSRCLAGVRGRTVIISLPGSSRGVRESMHALFPYIFHIHRMITGGGHRT